MDTFARILRNVTSLKITSHWLQNRPRDYRRCRKALLPPNRPTTSCKSVRITFFFYNVKTIFGTIPATESFGFPVFFFCTIIYDEVRVCLYAPILSFQLLMQLLCMCYGTHTVNNSLLVFVCFFLWG